MRLRSLTMARDTAAPRPGWHAIFTKAFALAARTWPRLRQAYLTFPRPHLYEHPQSVAAVALERSYFDEEAIFFAPITQPESLGLPELDHVLRRFKEEPLERVSDYRRQLRLTRLPGPLRRAWWWLTCNALGRRRAQRLGTFAVSAISALGAEFVAPLTPLTTTLTYGVIAPDGTVDVRLSYDARVVDGPTAARFLGELERVLTQEIVAELRYLQRLAAA
jgi:hypothetical protein